MRRTYKLLIAASAALAGSALAQHKPIIPPLTPPGGTVPEIRLPGEIKVIPTMPKPGQLPLPDPMKRLGGSSGTTVTPVELPYTPNVEAGKDTFSKRCVGCHWGSGKGVPGHDLSDAVLRRDYESLVAFIKAPTGDMPHFYPEVLDDHGVRDVAKHIQERFAPPSASGQ